MDKSSKQNINKVTEILNDPIEHLDLNWHFQDITSKKKKKKIGIYILLKCTWNILKDWSHMGHKTNLNKFKGIEIISSIFSDHNRMKLEINHRKRNEKKTDYMETKQHATKKPMGQWGNQEGN